MFIKIKKQNRVKNFLRAKAPMFFVFLMELFISAVLAFPVFASSTNGTIDSTYKYAWSENTGWINFGTSKGNVHITDSRLSGYALSETIGWIYLGDITNDGEGNLSGYAWSENAGWIKFNPTNGGVVINSSGKFTGSALGENIGWIIFDNCDYQVKTDWRPTSSRTASETAETKDINTRDIKYSSTATTITVKWKTDVKSDSQVRWGLNKNLSQEKKGGKKTKKHKIKIKNLKPDTLYYFRVRSKDSDDNSDRSRIYSVRTNQTIIERIHNIFTFQKKSPQTKPTNKETSPEKIVPRETPLAMRGQWELLPRESIKAFALAPLPKEFQKLAEKFPKFGETLKKVGITKIADIEKLKTAKLTLPGLTERVGTEEVPLHGTLQDKFALPKAIPIAKLAPEIKQKMPTEIVFAKAGGQLIDFNIALTVDKKGEPQQKIATISGKPLQLVVKPDKPVKSVKGYVVFKSKKHMTYNLKPKTQKFQLSNFKFQDLANSLIFANPVFAHSQDKPVRVEEKLVLSEFEYTDPDGDGIYTANIQAPAVEGEYEIITVMDFKDPKLGKKEIRLITVVDPEGYVFEKIGNKETRIPGAVVSIYWLNPHTKQYELWPAKEYQQENPQITNATGKYSFLVPEGNYYLKVKAPGYLIYKSKPFQIKEGSGIHTNIELKTKYWWLKIIDWKIIVMIIFGALLLYNFYRDRQRIKN